MEAFLVFGVPAGSEGIRGDTRCILKEHKNTLNPQVAKKEKERKLYYLFRWDILVGGKTSNNIQSRHQNMHDSEAGHTESVDRWTE